MTEKKIGGKDKYVYEYDLRGNLTKESYVKNNGKATVTGTYTYDETNKMVQGTNEAGEISLYIYNGLGGLVGGEMIVDKNAYGYHKFDNITPSVPTTLKKHEVIKKDFVLDYTTELMNTLYETEYQGLNYRYGYGTDRISAFITPIPNGGGNLVENGAIKVYYHKDYLGTTDFLTSDYTGKVVSWTMYNEWGELTHNAVLNCGVRELDFVKNYTGYEYDSVIGLYFAKNRMYDPEMHRFTQLDPIKDGLNWYAYVDSNPVNYVDPLGLNKDKSKENIKPHVRSGQNKSDAVKALQRDEGLSAWLFVTLGVKKDAEYAKQGKTIYYLPQDYWQSIECVGYNAFYNWVFDTFTDMDSITFDFEYNGIKFRIWAWKGDYLNMGAGAELGIYYDGPGHWKTGKDYAMKMTIKLEDKNGVIFDRTPGNLNWWVSGFDPNRTGVLAADLSATFTLDFSGSEKLKGMYDALTDSSDYTKYLNKWKKVSAYKLKLEF